MSLLRKQTLRTKSLADVRNADHLNEASKVGKNVLLALTRGVPSWQKTVDSCLTLPLRRIAGTSCYARSEIDISRGARAASAMVAGTPSW